MSKKYVDYIVEETKKILSIDSPSGYTKEVADYVMGEYRKLGYEPKLTVKGGVLVALGGKEKDNAVLLEAHIDTLGAMVAEIKPNGPPACDSGRRHECKQRRGGELPHHHQIFRKI